MASAEEPKPTMPVTTTTEVTATPSYVWQLDKNVPSVQYYKIKGGPSDGSDLDIDQAKAIGAKIIEPSVPETIKPAINEDIFTPATQPTKPDFVVDEAGRTVPQAFAGQEGFLDLFKRKGPKQTPFAFAEKETEDAFTNAFGRPKEGLVRRLTNLGTSLKNKATREFEHLPLDAEHAPLRSELLKITKKKEVADEIVVRDLYDIIKGLSDEEYNVFIREVMLKDFQATLDAPRGDPKQKELFNAGDPKLPFGFDRKSVGEELTRLADEKYKIATKDAKINVRIDLALAKRKALWDALRDEYLETMKAAGLDVSERVKRQDYFRHEVLRDYSRMLEITKDPSLTIPTARPWLKRRKGSEKAINTNYAEVEYDVMSQMRQDIEIAKLIKFVKDKYGVKTGIFNEFRNWASKRPDGLAAKLIKEVDNEVARIEAATGKKFTPQEIIDRTKNKLEESEEFQRFLNQRDLIEWTPNRQSVFYMTQGDASIMSMKIVQELINDIAAGTPLDVDKLLKKINMETLKGEIIPKTVAATLDNMLKDDSSRNIFLKLHKNILKKWKQWQLMSPKRFIKYNTRNLTGDADAAFAGNPAVFSQVPTALADINKLYTKGGAIKGVIKGEQHEKARRRVFGPDGKLVDMPNIYTLEGEQVYVPNDLADYLKRGGGHATLQSQEMGDLDKGEYFKRKLKTISGDSELLDLAKKAASMPAKAWFGYWKQTRLRTDQRELILRYAAYKQYLKEIKADANTETGGSGLGRPVNFGASDPKQVMAVGLDRKGNLTEEGMKDRAYWMSNDLLGAYDKVSVMGQALRENIIPFWSWNEVNVTRYLRLLRNLSQDDKMLTAIGKAFIGKNPQIASMLAKSGIKMTASAISKVGWLWFKITFVSSLIAGWNLTKTDKEGNPLEEKLPDNVVSRPHIIKGEDENGEVEYFPRVGAFGDMWDWLSDENMPNLTEGLTGLYKEGKRLESSESKSNYPEWIDKSNAFKDYLNGEAKLPETIARMAYDDILKSIGKSSIKKLVGGFEPVTKTIGEIITRRSLFPDPFSPQTIRDRMEYLFNAVTQHPELYRWLAEKPSPMTFGKYAKSLVWYNADPLQSAYSNTMSRLHKYLEKEGKDGEGFYITPKGDALYNMRMAMRYKQDDLIDKYLSQYFELGGTEQGLNTALRRMEPMSGVNENDKAMFISTLDEKGIRDLMNAYLFYAEILSGEDLSKSILAPKAEESKTQQEGFQF
jgi:hypothetical protein